MPRRVCLVSLVMVLRPRVVPTERSLSDRESDFTTHLAGSRGFC